MSADGRPRMRIVTLVEKPGAAPLRVRIGTAYKNADETWNLYLDVAPITGRLQLLPWKEGE